MRDVWVKGRFWREGVNALGGVDFVEGRFYLVFFCFFRIFVWM